MNVITYPYSNYSQTMLVEGYHEYRFLQCYKDLIHVYKCCDIQLLYGAVIYRKTKDNILNNTYLPTLIFSSKPHK